LGIISLTLDVLKPRMPTIVELAKQIERIKGVERVEIVVEEIDEKTESLKIVITGRDLDYDKIHACIERMGASIHSVDRVITGAPQGRSS